MMFEIIIALLICSLLGGAVVMMWVCAWDFFESTELWDVIKEKMRRKDE